MSNSIQHYLAPRGGDLPGVLGHWLPPDEAHRLLHRGAVYAAGKRAGRETRVQAGDWIRIHHRPKRFFPAGRDFTPWFEEGPDYVVAYKPAGIPMHPSLDNLWENLQRQLEIVRGEKLFTGGRLDVGTQGLVAFGRTSAFVRRFHETKPQWIKSYRALIPVPIPPGRHTHYMDRKERPPYRLRPLPFEGAAECVLDVLSLRPVGRFWEVEIRLVTGRTHQIRAQMAALGAPLVGDRLYRQGEGDPRWIGLQCFELSFEGNRFRWEDSPWSEK